MIVFLWREGPIHVIDKKYPDVTSNSGKQKIKWDSLSVIQLSLTPNVLCEVSTSTEEMTKLLQERIEWLYQDNSTKTRMLLQ